MTTAVVACTCFFVGQVTRRISAFRSSKYSFAAVSQPAGPFFSGWLPLFAAIGFVAMLGTCFSRLSPG